MLGAAKDFVELQNKARAGASRDVMFDAPARSLARSACLARKGGTDARNFRCPVAPEQPGRFVGSIMAAQAADHGGAGGGRSEGFAAIRLVQQGWNSMGGKHTRRSPEHWRRRGKLGRSDSPFADTTGFRSEWVAALKRLAVRMPAKSIALLRIAQ
jgi:hypothetical protein